MATLSDGTTTVTIPDDLEWSDEFDFSPVTQDTRRTIGGSLISQEATLQFGRPITLAGGPEVWMRRGDFNTVVTMAQTAGASLVLTLAGNRVFNVMFNRQQTPHAATPLQRTTVYTDDSMMNNVVLRFLTIEAPTP